MNIIKKVKALLSFFTTIPTHEKDVELCASAFYLVPLVGLIEGSLIGIALSVTKILTLSTDIIAALYMILHLIVTGGIHLDGYADYLDVIGSRKRGYDALKVMKDPRRGSFAIVALTLSLLVSYASVRELASSLDPFELTLLLTFLYISAAESMYVIAFVGKEEPYEGLGRTFSKHAKFLRNVIANLIVYSVITLTFVVTNVRTSLRFLALVILTFFTSYIVYKDSDQRLGFVTGDVMGFAYELLRAVGLLTLSVIS